MDPIVTRNLVRYLTGKRLIDRAGIVDGGMVLTMSRSRNRFVMLKQRGGPSYFIKQAIETEPGTRETIAREAEVYRGAFGDDRLRPLRDLLPEFRLYDAEQGILISDLVPSSETLTAVHKRLGTCPVDLAARLGAALATYHAIRFVEGAPQAALFPQQPPWILKLHDEADLSGMRRSPAASELVDILLAAPGAGALLRTLREGWRRDTLIHTDMRWENCLLAPKSEPLATRRLYVIDWELADIGDAAWDVGSMLQSYLAFWIASMPAGSDPAALFAGATVPLDDVRLATAAFWSAYIDASDAYQGEPHAFLARCIGMMAARMMVTAFERSAWSQVTDPTAILLAQTALNILADPDPVAAELLGILDPAPRTQAQAA
ncbi:phosphotransferase family protein [Sphingomonas faeni]|uniref:phosphotransferase family protein n=1 Tax=Sphingomonas faeni TaxID=185950 RepID=UPI003347A8B2